MVCAYYYIHTIHWLWLYSVSGSWQLVIFIGFYVLVDVRMNNKKKNGMLWEYDTVGSTRDEQCSCERRPQLGVATLSTSFSNNTETHVQVRFGQPVRPHVRVSSISRIAPSI